MTRGSLILWMEETVVAPLSCGLCVRPPTKTNWILSPGSRPGASGAHSWLGPHSPLPLASPFGRPHPHGSSFLMWRVGHGGSGLGPAESGPHCTRKKVRKQAWPLAFSEPWPKARLSPSCQPPFLFLICNLETVVRSQLPRLSEGKATWSSRSLIGYVLDFASRRLICLENRSPEGLGTQPPDLKSRLIGQAPDAGKE